MDVEQRFRRQEAYGMGQLELVIHQNNVIGSVSLGANANAQGCGAFDLGALSLSDTLSKCTSSKVQCKASSRSIHYLLQVSSFYPCRNASGHQSRCTYTCQANTSDSQDQTGACSRLQKGTSTMERQTTHPDQQRHISLQCSQQGRTAEIGRPARKSDILGRLIDR